MAEATLVIAPVIFIGGVIFLVVAIAYGATH